MQLVEMLWQRQCYALFICQFIVRTVPNCEYAMYSCEKRSFLISMRKLRCYPIPSREFGLANYKFLRTLVKHFSFVEIVRWNQCDFSTVV